MTAAVNCSGPAGPACLSGGLGVGPGLGHGPADLADALLAVLEASSTALSLAELNDSRSSNATEAEAEAVVEDYLLTVAVSLALALLILATVIGKQPRLGHNGSAAARRL